MLMVLIKKLACLSRLDELITNACDTSFLYWHKLILPVYFEQLFKGKTEAYRLNVSIRPSDGQYGSDIYPKFGF